MSHTEKPDFGPPGYLPERASKRARKIILRAPLGLQWVIGALVAGMIVVVAGVVFLQRSDDPPPEPWTMTAEVAQLEASEVVELSSATGASEVLIVTAGGRVRAFADPPEVAYCAASNLLEAADGRSWNLTGRGLEGTASLDQHPALVQDGRLYVDPSTVTPGPEPTERTAATSCT